MEDTTFQYAWMKSLLGWFLVVSIEFESILVRIWIYISKKVLITNYKN
jgi:hypothetical protein